MPDFKRVAPHETQSTKKQQSLSSGSLAWLGFHSAALSRKVSKTSKRKRPCYISSNIFHPHPAFLYPDVTTCGEWYKRASFKDPHPRHPFPAAWILGSLRLLRLDLFWGPFFHYSTFGWGHLTLDWNIGQQWLWTTHSVLSYRIVLSNILEARDGIIHLQTEGEQLPDHEFQLWGLRCGNLGNERNLNPEFHKVRWGINVPVWGFWLCTMSLVAVVLWCQPQKKHCVPLQYSFFFFSYFLRLLILQR